MNPTRYSAFEGTKLLFQGEWEEVVLKIKRRLGKSENNSILIFSDLTGKTMDFNFQGTRQEILKRLEMFRDESSLPPSGGPGRPKLGVVSREVSLLPRHWEWLANQPGGASVTLRNLVEEAKRKSASGQNLKQIQERTYKFMSVIAGDFKGYEEALRALYKRDQKAFLAQIQEWPRDVREHTLELATSIFAETNV